MMKRTRVSLAIGAAFGAGLIGLAPEAVAQTQQLERVEITGSSLRRVDAETALPVTVIKAEELSRQGITTVEQALKIIPQNQTSQGIAGVVGAFTGGAATVDLRGLGAATGSSGQRTLVLLNGRRLANAAYDAGAVDLNSIPMAAIDRIEVLRDGASAIYGTDAIGGVVNFILRRDYQGLDVSGEYLSPTNPGGTTYRASISGGYGSLEKQGFNVMATLDYRKQDVVLGADRPYAATGNLLASRGVEKSSGTTFPATLVDTGFNPSAPGCAPPGSFWNGSACRFDYVRYVDLIPENEQLSMLLRGSMKFGEHVISAEYVRGDSKNTAAVSPTPLTGMDMPSSSPFYPAGATGNIVNWRMIPGGKRTSADDAVGDRALLEATGLVAGWDYKTGVFQSTNKVSTDFKDGYLNADGIQAGLNAGLLNPFGAQTSAGNSYILSQKILGEVLQSEFKSTGFDARVSKDMFQMNGGPSALAVGFEYRKDTFKYDLNEAKASQAASSGLELAADVNGDRNVTALFAEMNFPFTKTIEGSLALRYDNYSDVGGTVNPKVSMRWQPQKGLLFRGSYNTGFRAPTLYDIYQPNVLTYTSDSYDDPKLCPGGTAVPGTSASVVCGQQVLQRLGGPVAAGKGDNGVEPEKSKTFSLGMVFEPTNELTFGVDYYNIAISNLISNVPEQAIFGDATKYASQIVRCSALSAADRAKIDTCATLTPTMDPIAYIDTPTQNLGDVKTSGFDVSFAWRFPTTSYGRFGLSLDGTYVLTYKYQREQNGAWIDAAGAYTDNAPVFRWQHMLTGTWGAGPWLVTLAQNYKTGYIDQDPSNSVKSYQLWDATITWTGIKNLTFMFGMRNILDAEPPYSNQVTTFQANYDPRYTDTFGRTWVTRIGYKFF
jgi:iron complex outermembrane recepter protein